MTIKVLKILVPSVFAVNFSIMVILMSYFTTERPQSPQAELNRITPVKVNYGKTVYVTSTEAKWLNTTFALNFVGAGIFICYVVVGVAKKKRETGGF
jgi:GTP cyclohydrolase III